MSILEIRTSANDASGRQLARLLHAVVQVDRFGALRLGAVHALAPFGVLLWIGVAFPHSIPEGLLRYALGGFALVAVVAVTALVLEWRWQGVQRRCMQENEVRVLDDDRDGADQEHTA